VDDGIPYTTCRPETLTQPPAPKVESVIPLYLSQDKTGRLPLRVETWCMRCELLTVTSTGENVSIDEKPRWTIGTYLAEISYQATADISHGNGRL